MRVYFLGARYHFLGAGYLPERRIRRFPDGLFIETHAFFINSKGKDDFRPRLVAAPLEEKMREADTVSILERKVTMLLRPPVDGSSPIDRPWDAVYKIQEILDEESGKDVYKEKAIYAIVKKLTIKHRHMLVNLRAMDYFVRYMSSTSTGEEKRLCNYYSA
jgi:hypothetical protein